MVITKANWGHNAAPVIYCHARPSLPLAAGFSRQACCYPAENRAPKFRDLIFPLSIGPLALLPDFTVFSAVPVLSNERSLPSALTVEAPSCHCFLCFHYYWIPSNHTKPLILHCQMWGGFLTRRELARPSRFTMCNCCLQCISLIHLAASACSSTSQAWC